MTTSILKSTRVRMSSIGTLGYSGALGMSLMDRVDAANLSITAKFNYTISPFMLASGLPYRASSCLGKLSTQFQRKTWAIAENNKCVLFLHV